jgi:hypothetical protein
MPRRRRDEPIHDDVIQTRRDRSPNIGARGRRFVKPDEELSLLIEEIRSSKGQQVMDEVARLQASVRLVGRNKVELIRALEVLKQDDLILQLYAETNRPILTGVIEDVGRLLANFLASAFSLVDHARRQRLSPDDDDPEFDEEIHEQIERRFSKDDAHNVANGLRNYLLHRGILPITADLKVIRGAEIRSDGFKLSTNELLKWDRWTTKERTILARMGKTIDVGELATRYFSKVERFYIWLWGRQFEIYATEIMITNALQAKAQSIDQQIGSKISAEPNE